MFPMPMSAEGKHRDGSSEHANDRKMIAEMAKYLFRKTSAEGMAWRSTANR